MNRMVSLALATIACAGFLACSDDGETNGAGGTGGGGVGWWCTCNDGVSAVVQEPADVRCAELCEAAGGVGSVEPRVSAIGTSECNAFCNQADSLGCPGPACASGVDFWCTAGPGECFESLTAKLACTVEQGQWSCDDVAWQVQSTCPTFTDLCGAGGTGGG